MLEYTYQQKYAVHQTLHYKYVLYRKRQRMIHAVKLSSSPRSFFSIFVNLVVFPADGNTLSTLVHSSLWRVAVMV